MLVRSDLAPGLQLAQCVHGAFEFSHSHPWVMKKWLENSNYLVVLAVPDEDALLAHAGAVQLEDVDWCLVREPDIGNEATALVIAPSSYYKHLANLPCALKELAMT